MACSGGCGCSPCSCIDLQIPRGNTGATGATGQQGAAATNGTNGTTILYSDGLNVPTGAVASPATLRTFAVTPAMFNTNGQVIEVDTWAALTTTSIAYVIAVQVVFGGTAIGVWAGYPTVGLIRVNVKIQRVSASAQRCTATVYKGINILTAWTVTGSLVDATADLSVNNNLEVKVLKTVGNLLVNEVVSQTILITKFN